MYSLILGLDEWVGGGGVEKLTLKLSQLPTKVEIEIEVSTFLLLQ